MANRATSPVSAGSRIAGRPRKSHSLPSTHRGAHSLPLMNPYCHASACQRKGSDKYLMIVTDHDTAQVAWIGEGRCQDNVRAFLDALGPVRARLLTHVCADGAEWIHDVIRKRPRRRRSLSMPFTSSNGPVKPTMACAAGLPPSCAPPGRTIRPPPSARACGRCARTTRS